ncbi:NAD(P)H-dependent oxidoreductase [Psychrosphaera sp. B3R10]|uniref:NADPH-dependent FMN reductase n=1 Tax=unclassified Psychrosphaera TaxID=2641570 RepID=UPI001C081578|nr:MULTISPECIES: NAD(P)H-dependent oxidoreductase [unclassified Psychrosphaera]MBU2882131.1 NAD(P)H-dependent oxidoreductase [Psychrosphaera sp. I2R16]MBU2988812.1 NAD(P)H-dependent oxidoreductase [Psychrosphaera sp. B3R10]MDO6717832.1 NAD(P)H-dependent oxidoreductase [Psychrosphaera sp. 1_MG-2023]
MKVLTLAGSNSANSINKQLAIYATSLIENAEADIIDINDYEMPIFSMEREAELGQPEQAKQFHQKIADADAIVISFAEYNGSYSAAFKNLFDWTSRIDPKVYQNKPMLLLATSPGPGGAASVLNTAVTSAPYFNGDVKASLSIPSFYDNFDVEQGKLSNAELNDKLQTAVALLTQ